MNIKVKFFRFLLILLIIVFAAFSLEFWLEWLHLGQPDLKKLSWVNVNDNTQLINILSAVSRAYGNIVAMLLAAIALAIPFTAINYTPKLIEMFLYDRINQFMLLFWAIGAAHVLWVLYIIGPDFAPTIAYIIALFVALIGWVILIPYFFYILRYLEPKNILKHFAADIDKMMMTVSYHRHKKNQKKQIMQAQKIVNQHISDMCAILLKVVDRSDRSVIPTTLRVIQEMITQYINSKSKLPEDWFNPPQKFFYSISKSAFGLLVHKRTWVEHRVLTQFYIAYSSALVKCSDMISLICKITRLIAMHAAEKNDIEVLKLAIKIFNNYMREAIKKKEIHALFDLSYQYRELAVALADHDTLIQDIMKYFIYYYHFAKNTGLEFGTQVITFDLYSIVRQTYEMKSTSKKEILTLFLSIDGTEPTSPSSFFYTKLKIMLGGFFIQHNLQEEILAIQTSLANVPRETLRAIESECMTITDPSFWEVTDRQMVFEWIPLDERPAFQQFIYLICQSQ